MKNNPVKEKAEHCREFKYGYLFHIGLNWECVKMVQK